MALIKNLTKGYKDRESIHNETSCSYYIVTDGNCNKYLQIDTYGSEDRAIPGKVSQSVQFSPEAIKQLKNILESFY